jgi:hypothetical protein
MATTDERLAALEAMMAEMRHGQEAVSDQVRAEGEAQREELRKLGEELHETLLAQSTSILAVSTGMNKLRGELMKWMGVGALVGAVALFIAVRALGF